MLVTLVFIAGNILPRHTHTHTHTHITNMVAELNSFIIGDRAINNILSVTNRLGLHIIMTTYTDNYATIATNHKTQTNHSGVC